MAKKRSRRRKPVRARSRRSVKSTRTPKAGATGPVTLAQARALAKARALLERGAKLALEPASPATVGLERRKLEKKQELERRKRIKEYKATLAIMKKERVIASPRLQSAGWLLNDRCMRCCRRMPFALTITFVHSFGVEDRRCKSSPHGQSGFVRPREITMRFADPASALNNGPRKPFTSIRQ